MSNKASKFEGTFWENLNLDELPKKGPVQKGMRIRNTKGGRHYVLDVKDDWHPEHGQTVKYHYNKTPGYYESPRWKKILAPDDNYIIDWEHTRKDNPHTRPDAPMMEGYTNMTNSSNGNGKLYEFNHNGVKVYAHKLAVNSEGKWVMELKETGVVVAVDKEDCTEVIPNAVRIKFVGGGTCDYHYPKGILKRGDVISVSVAEGATVFGLAVVTKADFGSNNATKELKVFGRVKFEPVG